MNTTFNVTGFAGMTRADTIGLISIVLFIFVVSIICLILTSSSRRDRHNVGSHWNPNQLRSPDRQYNRAGNQPTSDSGFGTNRSAAIVQDPAGYWRTAQAYEAPIGVARVPRQNRMSRPLALTASPTTGYRTDPRQSSLLGLQEPLDVVPVSPPMYPVPSQPQPQPQSQPVVSYDEYFAVAPTSPAAPSASAYAPRPVSMARDEFPEWNDDPTPVSPSPYFNPLGQTYAPQATAVVSAGRHSRLTAQGAESQRHWTQATGQLDLIELRQLLAVG